MLADPVEIRALQFGLGVLAKELEVILLLSTCHPQKTLIAETRAITGLVLVFFQPNRTGLPRYYI